MNEQFSGMGATALNRRVARGLAIEGSTIQHVQVLIEMSFH